MNLSTPFKFLRFVLVAAALFLPFITLASTGSIDGANKYAWGSNIGWINFSPTNGGVQVSDTGLSGYVWNDNYGWINLSPSAAGVRNDGTGVLSGYAWGQNIGYVSFSGVTITPSGVFTGSATSSFVGTLSFDCANCRVATTWRPGPAPPTIGVPPAGAVPYIPGVGPVASTSATSTAIASSPSASSSQAMASSTSIDSARARLIAELQAKLQSLLAQVKSLQITTSSGGNPPITLFLHDLKFLSAGREVTRLQRFLISNAAGPAARALAAHGVTATFATLTRAAVIEFQKEVGVPATGYFGPLTRARVNTILDANNQGML